MSRKNKNKNEIEDAVIVVDDSPESAQQNEGVEVEDIEIEDIEVDSDHLNTQEQIEIIGELLPLKVDDNLPVPSSLDKQDPLRAYLKEISRYKLLTPEEEKELTQQLVETGDIDVAKKLVMANLRLVVKIAMEYRSSYKNVLDLIQEGNIGLMKAVSKYNPEKGAKLSYYASWWIKSYILKFILDNFRLIKLGTTAEQKKLFYNLMREKERLENLGIKPEPKLIAENLDVSEKAVIEMDRRLSSSGSEVSMDRPISPDGTTTGTLADFISDDFNLEEDMETHQGIEILNEHLEKFVEDLKPRDKEIFKKRLLSEVPPSLQQIGDEYGISRERVRQIESRLMDKLKVYMSEYIR